MVQLLFKKVGSVNLLNKLIICRLFQGFDQIMLGDKPESNTIGDDGEGDPIKVG